MGGLGSVLDPGAAAALAASIQRMEGYYPGSLAYKNNNPGNLMFVGQAGAVRAPDGFFASFPSYDAGYRALLSQLENYAGRGLTIQSMIAIYAPAGHGANDPGRYADFVAGQLGVAVNTPLSQLGGGSGSVGGGSPDVFGSEDTGPDSSAWPDDLAAADDVASNPLLLAGLAVAAAFVVSQALGGGR